ncbi:MAG: hypothetical protein ACI8X5_003912 [Planctomycetota bacterium]|jgi:hypothetical protein
MKSKLTLCAISALFLSSSSYAQQSSSARPITSKVKDAGTYHFASGTWTSSTTSTALAGPEELYNNTCTSNFYWGVPAGSTVYDSGRIPSTSDGGKYDAYNISCFSFAYCSFNNGPVTLGVSFYDCYSSCLGAASAVPAATFNLVNLPGGPGSNAQGCWIITFDLANTTLGFDLAGDCNGTFDGTASTDSFGWSWTQLSTVSGSDSGLFIAGDPLGILNTSCGSFSTGWGTVHPGPGSWGPASGGLNGAGTGIGILDQMELTGSLSGCFWFGGYHPTMIPGNSNPFTAFYHELWGGEAEGPIVDPGTSYCSGDGTGAACPGGVVSSTPGAGCPNGLGSGGALLTSHGDASIGLDTYGFDLSGGAATKPGIMITGGSAIAYPNGNATIANSAGLFCVAPQQRGKVTFTDASGSVTINEFQVGVSFGAAAQPVGNSTFYQYWQRDPQNPNANGGPSGGSFNFSNAHEVIWQ